MERERQGEGGREREIEREREGLGMAFRPLTPTKILPKEVSRHRPGV